MFVATRKILTYLFSFLFITCNGVSDGSGVIMFGSCNRQNLPQNFWRVLGHFKPQSFIWTGDAVYTKSNSLRGLMEAYDQLETNSYYRNFRNRTIIHGIWDDHDYGVNDGGRHVPGRRKRQQLYSNFIGNSHDSILSQDGLYHTFVFGVSPAKIRFILLDTRFFRDNHFVRSLGEVKFPLTALFAAFFRFAYTTLGFGFYYNGDILGDAQWAWLEQTLQTSDADFHVVVSSIQVLTSNPILESWGHFPAAKRHLFDVMSKYDPSGLLFLSGDIHAAELLQAPRLNSHQHRKWVEVTSSGLTHTCADSILTQFICPLMMRSYKRHRYAPGMEAEGEGERSCAPEALDMYIGTNFGTLQIVSDDGAASSSERVCLEVTVHALAEVEAALNGANESSGEDIILDRVHDTGVIKTRVCNDNAVDVVGESPSNGSYSYPDFFQVSSLFVCVIGGSFVLTMFSVTAWWFSAAPNNRG